VLFLVVCIKFLYNYVCDFVSSLAILRENGGSYCYETVTADQLSPSRIMPNGLGQIGPKQR